MTLGTLGTGGGLNVICVGPPGTRDTGGRAGWRVGSHITHRARLRSCAKLFSVAPFLHKVIFSYNSQSYYQRHYHCQQRICRDHTGHIYRWQYRVPRIQDHMADSGRFPPGCYRNRPGSWCSDGNHPHPRGFLGRIVRYRLPGKVNTGGFLGRIVRYRKGFVWKPGRVIMGGSFQ